MKLGRYSEVEPMAKEIWDRRRETLPDNAKDIRTISKDYCDILRRNGKHAEAEGQYGLSMQLQEFPFPPQASSGEQRRVSFPDRCSPPFTYFTKTNS